MYITSFSVSCLPRIEFGAGVLDKLPALARSFGTRALLVTGAQSFCATSQWSDLTAALSKQGIIWEHVQVPGEPSPTLIDNAVRAHRNPHMDVVIGVGGGSALDAAKAIAGLLQTGNSVMDHLEGVGPELAYRGPATPFIAVPTTAGTGSEATKNAVLSVQLENWTAVLNLPRLAHYKVQAKDIPHIVDHSRGSSMQTNPVKLDDSEIARVITARL